MVYRVTEAERQRLKKLQEAADRNAIRLGVGLMSLLELADSIRADTINLSRAQQEIGEAILKAHGFDYKERFYTIELETGAVKEVSNGELRDVPDKMDA